jgi:hypothetical protein
MNIVVGVYLSRHQIVPGGAKGRRGPRQALAGRRREHLGAYPLGCGARQGPPTRHAAAVAMRLACLLAVLLASASGAAAQETQPQGSPVALDSTTESYSVANAYRVQRILGDGGRIELGDGTVWEVYLPDRPAVNLWRRGDVLVVRPASLAQGEYDYTLVNGRTKDRVAARFAGSAPSR